MVAVAAAAATAEEKSDWRTQARLAMLALRLGDAQPAATLCELRPDPIRRLIFIEECAQWHGDPEGLVVAIQDLDARLTHLRSAVALVLGSMPFEELTPAARSAGAKLLAAWYANDPDGGLHSASGWALRKWGLPLPAIAPSANLPEKMRWHVNRLGMTVVEIPAGTFVRKDTRGGSIDQSVTITRSFLLATHEVTVAQFRTFLADADTAVADIPGNWKGLNSYTPGEQHPAGTLSWYAAVQFCNWLSRREGLRPCYTKSGAQETDLNGKSHDAWQLDLDSEGYRLPTEAEWDYASRSGAASAFSYGEELTLITRYAVFGSTHTEVPGSRMPQYCPGFGRGGVAGGWRGG